MKILVLAIVIATVCPGDVCPDRRPAEPELPAGATDTVVHELACIVQSEGMGIPSSHRFIATQLWHDVQRGYSPWALHSRWYGYNANPSAAVKASVRDALANFPMYPRCKFTGNISDAGIWLRGHMAYSIDYVFHRPDNKNGVVGMDCSGGW